MKYTTISGTELKVSKICLGTMTFGEQNTEAQAHEQLDYAIERGINFIDTAEMYPVPGRAQTYGDTERIIGSWVKKRKNRNSIILASKIVGPDKSRQYIRKNPGFSKEAIREAIDKSLQRLQTDYIDLYQLHWPERNANFFGQRDFKYHPDEQWEDNFKAILENLNQLVSAGKIRYWGLSNETPWGVMHYLRQAEKYKLPKPISIQNPYSLLNRTFETGLAEISIREQIGLLAYSPLAYGILTGKYLSGTPENARLALFPQMVRYSNIEARKVTAKYAKLAEKYDLRFAKMALAFIHQQPFLTATIIGATTMRQLAENIDSIHTILPEELLSEIQKIHRTQPNPAP